MKNEIIEIIKSQQYLGIDLPFELPEASSLISAEFYFIVLNNNPEKENGSTPKQTIAGYFFKNKRWGCKKLTGKYSVEESFKDITKK